MSKVTIWHNPRCSKSRQTLALLEARGVGPRIRLYLSDPPDEAEIRAALTMLGTDAAGLLRRGEPILRELGLSAASAPDALVSAMATHPILVERPIVFTAGRAVIGRPPEAVLALMLPPLRGGGETPK